MTARLRTPKAALQICSLASPAAGRGRLDRADARRPCRPARLWRKTLPSSQPLRGTARQRLRPSARREPDPAAPLVSGSRADLPIRLLRQERPARMPGLSPARRLRRASPPRARGSRLQSRTARAVRMRQPPILRRERRENRRPERRVPVLAGSQRRRERRRINHRRAGGWRRASADGACGRRSQMKGAFAGQSGHGRFRLVHCHGVGRAAGFEPRSFGPRRCERRGVDACRRTLAGRQAGLQGKRQGQQKGAVAQHRMAVRAVLTATVLASSRSKSATFPPRRQSRLSPSRQGANRAWPRMRSGRLRPAALRARRARRLHRKRAPRRAQSSRSSVLPGGETGGPLERGPRPLDRQRRSACFVHFLFEIVEEAGRRTDIGGAGGDAQL